MSLFHSLKRWLFDFSEGDANRREVEEILREALANSRTNAEFRAALGRAIRARETEAPEARLLNFRRFLARHRRAADRDLGIRAVAEHILEDLPRIYGYRVRQEK